ncbi:MAG: sigma-E factor regulatory protein RseB domain-containing protein [Candidatus Methylumidiphilus sp.]
MNVTVLRLFPFVFFALILVAFARESLASDTESEAKTWLNDARQAAAKLNYHGIVSYMKDKQIESLHVFHGVSDGVEQERLLSVNTPMREVIRTADKVTCYYPDSKSISIDIKPSRQSLLLDLPDDLAELSKHYTFSLGEIEHVARRPSRVVSIQPKDGLRYGRKLWIDVESKLPLKFEWIDGQQVVEQFIFNSLSLEKAIPPEEFNHSPGRFGTLDPSGQHLEDQAARDTPCGVLDLDPRWRAGWVPHDFLHPPEARGQQSGH